MPEETLMAPIENMAYECKANPEQPVSSIVWSYSTCTNYIKSSVTTKQTTAVLPISVCTVILSINLLILLGPLPQSRFSYHLVKLRFIAEDNAALLMPEESLVLVLLDVLCLHG